MVIFNDTIKLNVYCFLKPSCFMTPVFGDPPKNTPPPNFPPRVQNLAIFGTPPPDPPFFEVLAPDPLGHDPWPPTSWCSLILRFDLWWWSSIIIILIDDVMFINFIYKHYWLQSMHQGASSCMRLHASASRVLLQKNTLPLPITMAKSAFFTPPTAQERILPLYIGYIYPFIG